MATSSLHCLKLEQNLRKTIAESLVPTSKIKVSLVIGLLHGGRSLTIF